jgi:hypothetical protein
LGLSNYLLFHALPAIVALFQGYGHSPQQLLQALWLNISLQYFFIDAKKAIDFNPA